MSAAGMGAAVRQPGSLSDAQLVAAARAGIALWVGVFTMIGALTGAHPLGAVGEVVAGAVVLVTCLVGFVFPLPGAVLVSAEIVVVAGAVLWRGLPPAQTDDLVAYLVVLISVVGAAAVASLSARQALLVTLGWLAGLAFLEAGLGTPRYWFVDAVMVGLGLAAGLVLRFFLHRASLANARISSLRNRGLRLRLQERHNLSEELSALLRSSFDADEALLRGIVRDADHDAMRACLETVGRSASASLGRLRVLTSTLREAGATSDGETLWAFEDAATGSGFEVEFEPPGQQPWSGPAAAAASQLWDLLTVAVPHHAVPGHPILVERTPTVLSVTLSSDHPAERWEADLEEVRRAALDVGAFLRVSAPDAGVVRLTLSATPEGPRAPAGRGRGLTRATGTLIARGLGWPGVAAAAALAVLATAVLGWGPATLVLWLVTASVVAFRSLGAWALMAIVTSLLAATSHHFNPVAVLSAFPALTIGLTARYFVRLGRRQADEYRAALTESDAAPAEERRLLAGELHDLVAHQLSLVAVQVRGLGPADGPDQVRRTVGAVLGETMQARRDLDKLAGRLRRDGAGVEPLQTSPAATLDSLRQALEASGHPVRSTVVGSFDGMEETTARSLERILREASTNVLRYAPPGAPMIVRVDGTAEEIQVEVSSQLAPFTPIDPQSTGQGLIGLAERVELLGGSFSAGPREERWVVRARLPRTLVLAADSTEPGRLPRWGLRSALLGR